MFSVRLSAERSIISIVVIFLFVNPATNESICALNSFADMLSVKTPILSIKHSLHPGGFFPVTRQYWIAVYQYLFFRKLIIPWQILFFLHRLYLLPVNHFCRIPQDPYQPILTGQ